jgi:hypothetical protein
LWRTYQSRYLRPAAGTLSTTEKFFKLVLDASGTPPYKARSRRITSQKILGRLLQKLQCFSAFSLGLIATYRSFGIVTGIRADKKED